MLQTFQAFTFAKKKKNQRVLADPVNSRLRLHTIIRLRWIGWRPNCARTRRQTTIAISGTMNSKVVE